MHNENEKKEYLIVGKVEIGTDEYRDLIENKVKLEKENSDLYREKWEIKNEKEKVDKIVINQTKQINNLNEFIKEKQLTEVFDLWIFNKSKKIEEDEEE